MNAKHVEVLAVNSATFGLSFTNIESGMRIFLLALSIIYTTVMIYKLIKKNENANK